MSLFIASLNSGSNGNCYYVGNGQEGVLIDAGIPCREIEKRMANLKLPMSRVKAIFISHEHIDHIRGADGLAKRHHLPVYATSAMLNKSKIVSKRVQACSFRSNVPVVIGALKITPFAKQHDAVDPYSFIVEGDGIKIGVITDIGVACEQVIHYFKQCHAAFLESNYDEDMLENGGYPIRLKNRIRGGKGHLSNVQALELFIKHRPAFMSHLLLAHLSKNNNRPELVHELFSKHANNTNIIVASRYEETPVYHIYDQSERKPVVSFKPLQLSLFE